MFLNQTHLWAPQAAAPQAPLPAPTWLLGPTRRVASHCRLGDAVLAGEPGARGRLEARGSGRLCGKQG